MADKKTSSAKRKIYAVYDAKTDELLAFGNAAQCTALLNIKDEGTFRRIVYGTNRGELKKYAIVTMDECGDDE